MDAGSEQRVGADLQVTASSFEFDDFDDFRAALRGWDSDPVQISRGRLRLHYDTLHVDDLIISRIRANQRIADVSAIKPGTTTFVVALAQKTCCGVDVAPGSVIVMGSERDYRNVLSAGWESIEFTVSDELLHELGIFERGLLPRGLAPEASVIALDRGVVERVRKWGTRLMASTGELDAKSSGESNCDASVELAEEAREDVLSTLLPAFIEPRRIAAGCVATPSPRPRSSDQLVEFAIREYDTRLSDPTTMAHLARTVGCSRRTLELAFRAILGCSPSWYFRTRRLARARRSLRRGASVTEAAMAQRFVSLGRFSELYHRQFGELPSETMPRS